MKTKSYLLVSVAIAAAMIASGPAAASSARVDATAFLMNAAHDGNAQTEKFAGPLKLKWSYDFQSNVSYPLIVKNVVYVTTAGINGGYGTVLYAMDLKKGTVLWQKPVAGTYFTSYLTYDNGQIFVLNFDGQLSAFDAKTGAPGNSVHLESEYDESAAPVAYHGHVYVDEEYALYAVNEATGKIDWTQSGTQTEPAVGDSQIFTTIEPQHSAYSLSGGRVWSKTVGKANGADASYYHGHLYSPDGIVLDGATGKLSTKLNPIDLPAAFWTDASLTDFRIGVSKGKLKSTDTQTGNVAWNFSGDSQLITQPVVIGDTVAIGSSASTLYLLDAATGAQVWSGKVAAGIVSEQQGCCTRPWSAVAAGDGALIVPGDTAISVYVPAKK
jgi:outer membrane protein assembly factor BamB